MAQLDRTYPDNPLWVLCCCGGLPIIGLLKAIIVIVPQTIIVSIPCFLISIIILPKDVAYTYYTLLKTKQLGPNIKVMAFFLILPFFILWPVFVAICGILFGAGSGFVLPFSRTVDPKYHLLYGGIYDVWKTGAKWVGKFWVFENHSYFIYLRDYRDYNLAPGEEPFDIRIIDIFVGLFIAAIGIVVDGIGISLLSIIKFIPGLVRGYIYMFKAWTELSDGVMLACALFVLLAALLLPAVAVLVLAGCIIGGCGIGVRAAYIAYKFGIGRAFKEMWNNIVEFDKLTNESIFGNSCRGSCLECYA